MIEKGEKVLTTGIEDQDGAFSGVEKKEG